MSLLTRTLWARIPRRAMSGSSAPSTPSPPPTSVAKTAGDEKQVAALKKGFINHNEGVGYKHDPLLRDIYLNPLLTPPPRPPRTPEDFMNPERLGHWKSTGMDFVSPVADKYYYHEMMFCIIVFSMVTIFLYSYGPDYKLNDWARREAFLRLTKREALGLPLIDRNVVDPDRIVLPTEEELKKYPYPITQ